MAAGDGTPQAGYRRISPPVAVEAGPAFLATGPRVCDLLRVLTGALYHLKIYQSLVYHMPTPRQSLPDDLLGWIPLTPTVFFILMALADGPKHGYAIMKLSAKLSEGRVRMGPGALYTSIQRLVEEDLIEEAEPQEGEDQRRRVYGLTRRGRSLLGFEVGRLESVLKLARGLKLGSAGAKP